MATFQDSGINVLPVSIPGAISISGDIRDCLTGEPINGVKATLYSSNCKKMMEYTFNGYYNIFLYAGTYTVLFEKEGYGSKFLALVLQSDMEITSDIEMAPKISLVPASPGSKKVTDVDLFSGIVCEKIDADVIYSSSMCINSGAEVEPLDDVVDNFSCGIVCTSKLWLTVNLEKNLIFKLDQIKELEYDTRTIHLCYPLANTDGCCTDLKSYLNVKHVTYCKENNLVYNIARLKFIAYILKDNDVLTTGTPLDEC